MKTLAATARILATVTALGSICSCQSINHAAKPNAVEPSKFLTHASEMREEPKRSPFLRNWTNPSAAVADAVKTKTEIWIPPVSLDYLRPISKAFSKVESSDTSQKEAAKKLALAMRKDFVDAFKKSKQHRYEPAERPSKKSVTLELALVELNPNSISAGTFRTAVNIVAVPGIDTLLFRPLKSNIAIEGRLRNSSTGQPIFEFADNEESKSSLFFTFNNFTTYGQARQAIQEWAAQFEELTRTPADHLVKDSSSFVLLPW